MLKTLNVPGLWRQLAAATIVSVGPFCCGISFGWTSMTIPDLQRENNSLGMDPLTLNQASWLSSTLTSSSFFILLVCGVFYERFGSKPTNFIVALLYVLSWSSKLFATNFYHILAAQILNGMGDGFILFAAPLYITEITSVNVRGFLASFVLFSFKIGLLVGYIFGTVLTYNVFAIVGLVIAIFHFGGVLLPQSPVWLVRHRRIGEAEKSLMWLRQNDKSTVDIELTSLQKFKNEKVQAKSLSRLKELFRDRAVVKGQMIGLILALGQQLAGIKIVMLYTVIVFDAAESSIDPYVATIITGAMQVIAVGLSTVVIERTGRRPLLFISSIGVIICHITLGTLFLLQSLDYDISSFGWLPVVAVSVFAVTYCIGLGPMCYVVTNEVYHPDAASFCNSVTFFVVYFTGFMIAKFFPALGEAIGLHYCFFALMICCVCTFLLISIFVPETKGRTKEAILQELRAGKGKLDETK